ncbi:DotU family type IV/VI secretion system protein [Lignipirellula cremea]|uniref:Type IV / VI secretion system DotU domain-containing protein n=1 Tax=Lignipirellula cremea TaxID=2528010 RepID=A0A518DPT7_9BACT|nr:DotU family type IV/VI secretion system protein [Lignipirellula cremea]QDU93850.1 hypothetical protein Pla8534_16340 [Lignipirellula cremea]
MHPKTATLVYQVVDYGLRLQERLRQGESPDLETEQAVIKNLLMFDDSDGGPAARQGQAAEWDAAQGKRFFGVRYALVCWLDEVFCSDSDWGKAWNERKLEVELYGTNDRAWRFWEQARLAQIRGGGEAFEAYYLCVMLGFRGEFREHPHKLQSWTGAAKLQLGKVAELDWRYESDFDEKSTAPPLRGRARFRRMMVAAWAAVLLLTPVTAFFLVRKFAG